MRISRELPHADHEADASEAEKESDTEMESSED